MSVYLVAGAANSVQLAKADVCMEVLRGLPNVQLRRYVRLEDEWEEFLGKLCVSWQIQGWQEHNEVMVWTGNGTLIGSGDDFMRVLSTKYSIDLNPGYDQLEMIAEHTQALALAEKAGRGVAPAAVAADSQGSTVAVLLITPSAIMPVAMSVHEATWAQDMNRLLRKTDPMHECVLLKKTAEGRIYGWFDSNAEFGGAHNTIATASLTCCPPMTRTCFRHAVQDNMVVFMMAAAADKAMDLSTEQFDTHFASKEMIHVQQDAAARRLQARGRGRVARKGIAQKKEEVAERNEQTGAALLIQSRYKGNKDRAEMLEQQRAATTMQANFRGFKSRLEAEQEKASAVRIQSMYRGNKARA